MGHGAAAMNGARDVAGMKTKGHIVLIASTAAQRGEAFHADYAASKGALVSLTKSLSSELAGQGILCQLRGAGVGGDGDEHGCPERSGDV